MANRPLICSAYRVQPKLGSAAGSVAIGVSSGAELGKSGDELEVMANKGASAFVSIYITGYITGYLLLCTIEGIEEICRKLEDSTIRMVF